MPDYQGESKDGKRHGTGIYTADDNTKFTGTFNMGKRHGPGTLIFPNGDTLEAVWEQGVLKNGCIGVYT